MLEDVGEHIPYAKKDRANSTIDELPKRKHHEALVTLKKLWPEPDWVALFLDGMSVDVLASIYTIYHSLNKRPHNKEGYRFSNRLVTTEMWESAYIETVSFIREACEYAQSNDCLKKLHENFNEAFNSKGSEGYKAYSAGTKTPKTFFHPLAKRGKAGEYAKILPLLNWPLRVDAKKIPYFPIRLQHSKTKVISYSLGKFNKKSVSWLNSGNGYDNEFKTYEQAVEALLEYHGEEFIVVEQKRQTDDIYVPKKNTTFVKENTDNNESKTAEELLQTYAFRGIQFGNYLPQKERQSFVDNTFESLAILADILRIPNTWIGGGKLGLAFGARGQGSASAHFELELHVINLTRFNGPGCIAHEVFHAFDSRMASKWFGHSGLLSELLSYRELDAYIVNEQYRDRFNAFKTIVEACIAPSDYRKNAKALESQKGASKYWTKPSELCARAFEAFIESQLVGNSKTQKWLATGTREKDYPLNGMHPYPTGYAPIPNG